jgi:phosphotransferase family enzyme
VIERVERVTGARVVALEPVRSLGYTHAQHHVARLDDGRSVFVKAAVDELSAGWLRTERIVYENVRGSFIPEYIGFDDEGEQPLLLIEDLSDAHWAPPWRDGDVGAVLRSLEQIAAVEPPELDERDLPGWLGVGWEEVAADPEPFLSLGVASREWLASSLDVLRDAAARAPFAGDAFLHLDVRSDNIALRDGRAILVDWNWATVGNPLLDVVAFCPSLHAQGGPPPEEVVQGEGVAELAAAIAGFFASRAGLPPPETAPRVREGQLSQLRIALPWAIRLLNLENPS